METARPFAPETRSSDRLWFGFRPDKPGKRPGFTDSTGEYRDTRTGWLSSQSRANPSPGNSLLTGKITGNIAEFGPIAAPVAGKALVTAMASRQIPYAPLTGNFQRHN